VGAPIRPEFTRAFEYSDCWVDDARLVVLNAIDLRRRGGEVLTRTAVTSARRESDLWRVELDGPMGRRSVRARCLVNAAGPWVEEVLGRVAGVNAERRVRLVKGSHIVTRKFWDGPQAYLLQNTDKRVIFVNPYEGDKALIGTTDIPWERPAEDVVIEPFEVDYLLAVVNRYFRTELGPADVVHSFAGVRPLYDDNAANPSAVTRDYVFDVDPPEPRPDRPPILSVFGGKITTYRKLAEHALDKLAPFFPRMRPAWTATATLPGGDIPGADFARFHSELEARWPDLPAEVLEHLARLYGSDAVRLLDGVRSLGDLGRHFGGTLYEREAVWLIEQEWAVDAEDILSRRTKHGLHLDSAERRAFTAWLTQRAKVRPTATTTS
jgi:glycerol-3-phosphate dehydrogenase